MSRLFSFRLHSLTVQSMEDVRKRCPKSSSEDAEAEVAMAEAEEEEEEEPDGCASRPVTGA